MGLDYIFPTNELLGNMVSADQPAMKTIFNVDEEHQLATENWLKNYTTNTDTALDYLSKVTLRQTFDGMINMYRLVGGALCAILALMDPCVFIHYSDSNIRQKSLPEAMQSPMFMAYHDGQPFNDNMLRPCPMLENPEKLRAMVEASGAHSTDMQSPETADHLCAKCDAYAACWKPAADALWAENRAAKAARKG